VSTQTIGTEAASDRTARALAIRLLLRHPLLPAEICERHHLPFAELARQADTLRRWFDDVTGWRLTVDHRRGFARLDKRTGFGDITRPATSPRGSQRPFNRRRYTLLCLLLHTLENAGQQLTLRDLVDAVRTLTANSDTGIAPYNPQAHDERVAFIDAVLYLVSLGVLVEKDSRGDWINTPESGNALYHVDSRRLAHLLVTPHPAASAHSAEQLFREDRYGPTAQPTDASPPSWLIDTTILGDGPHGTGSTDDSGVESTDEQRRLAIRHRIMRRLLDSPSLHYEDMSAEDSEYLRQTIRVVQDWCNDAGFSVERRAEGWALIDEDDLASDIGFPAGETGSNLKQAALLTLDALVGRARNDHRRTFTRSEIRTHIAELLREHPRWAAAYQNDDGHTLTHEVLSLLEAFELVRLDPNNITLRPAGARYSAKLRTTATPEALWEDQT
jgi:uncharacterized protein (TIGR02678 family)